MSRFGVRLVAMTLAAALAAPVGWAQDGLQVRVLAGDGGINNIDDRVVVEPIVEVQDAQGKPVPKARVTFSAPSSGPSVTFFGASHTAQMTTDDSGRAQATGMTPNTEPGAFSINVEAEHEGAVARAVITQTNTFPMTEGAPKKKKMGWKLLTLVGVGVAAGIAIAVLSGDGDAETTPTSVGVGGVSVGAPR